MYKKKLNHEKPYTLDDYYSRNGVINPDSYVITTTTYSVYLKEWYKQFNSSQILVLDHSEFTANTVETMHIIERFLGIPMMFSEFNFPKNKSSKFFCFREFGSTGGGNCLNSTVKERQHAEYSPKEQQKIQNFFKPFNSELAILTGKTFEWSQ